MLVLFIAGLISQAAPLPAEGARPLGLELEGHVYHPVWSPGGQRLAVTLSASDDDSRLFIVPLDDGRPVEVSLSGASNPFSGQAPVAMNPTWDGAALLFEGTDASGHFRIFRAEGGRASALPVSHPGHLTFPSVAGERLAFVSDQTGTGDLYLLEAGGLRRLTDSPVPEMFPQLSPEGDRVVFSRKVGATEDLFVLDLATGQERVLAGGAGDQTRPVHAGEHVVYFDGARGPGLWDLVRIGPGGERTTLGRGVALPLRGRPPVSPDGSLVAWATPGEGNKVVVASVEEGWRVEIPTGQISVAEPAVVRRGGQIWLAWTGLPSNQAGWRRLWVEDVTDRLPSSARDR